MEPSNINPTSYSPLLGEEDVENNSSSDKSTSSRLTYIILVIIGILAISFVIGLMIFGDKQICNDDLSICESQGKKLLIADHINNQRRTARGVSGGVSPKSNVKLLGSFSCIWTNKMLAWQRTAFHFQPKENWMNGPVYYNGYYHLFYQYNPMGAVWGNIIWGHAVSKDLIHWRDLPHAMIADQWYDINGVWTGSATIDQDGKLIMVYTGATDKMVQVQNVAYPADPSDPLLIKWVKHPSNPVLVPPPGVDDRDFRDPTTAWVTSEGKWRMSIGSKLNTTGISLVYDTTDFINYELKSELLHAVPHTGMWECVDFFPVSKEIGLDTSNNAPGTKHVLKASLDDTRIDTYAIGKYDDATNTWIPDDPSIDCGIGLRYDYGLFYASKSFYDQSTKRRILWGWIVETDSESIDIVKGWASLMNVPRTVLLDSKTGSNLVQWPVEEVEKLRGKKKEFNISLRPGDVVPLSVGPASQLDIEAEFTIDKEVLNQITISDEAYSCPTSGGAAQRGALGPFGLSVLSTKHLSEKTPIYFYITKGSDGNFKTHFCTDLSSSSRAYDVDKAIYGSTVPVLKGEKLTMRILVDHSIVEAFAQQGRTCITTRVYPTKAIYNEAKLFLFSNASHATVNASVNVWQMKSAELKL
ncbi:hypothetical protein Leryth_016701 [Lithospermum erythrorhizon]|nr:hypothetical protein Leryth_016701 [Lithospermum erythrorhizon]